MSGAALAKVLMVQGTSSSVGKSLLVTALCRVFARRGVRVAPYKAQNMSNNAAVCADGSEIGRAQAVQAAAAGIEPTADMNPILLKPEADTRSQVIVMGRTWRTLAAGRYYQHRHELWPIATAALDRLRAGYDLVIVEGAGSPAELNLKAEDLANMAVARYAAAPVLLMGDIDRGGIFAQLLGTLWLLPSDERALVRGLVVNKFRGDPALFEDGVRLLEQHGDVPVLGVIPYLHDLAIPEEDAVALDQAAGGTRQAPSDVDIAVIRLPHIANFDDFDPLAREPGVTLRYVSSLAALGWPRAVILPGTKSTIADLAWLRAQGLAEAIQRLAQEGSAVVGLCGGYQMLGASLHDPHGVESHSGESDGLGLVRVKTVFRENKVTSRVLARVLGGPGWMQSVAGQVLHGYEIHMGHGEGSAGWLEIVARNGAPVQVVDGAVAADGRVWGCYLHGLFENAALRRAWLASLGAPSAAGDWSGLAAPSLSAFDRLADAVEAALQLERLEALVRLEL
ncbi:MAG TPA: cobyric acid synthase [Ardenticatenaceae bacterium]|nr:cobyric acid synthase [Ardenticatenaceae bacterium]